MGVWPPGVGLQGLVSNRRVLLPSERGVVVSDHGKGVLKASGVSQGDERKRTVEYASKRMIDVVKTGERSSSGISPEVTCLPTGRQPVYRRHDLDSGSCMERGNLFSDAKGNPQAVTTVRENTNAGNRDGAARSSDEASVMEVERRSCVIPLGLWINLLARRNP